GAVTIAATSSGCGDPRYRFWMQAPGAAWKIVQDYSNGTSTYRWSGSSAAGPYRFEADVRDASHSAAYDAVANTTYQVAACSAAGLTPDAGAPQAPGTTIFLTGSASCLGIPTYRFWIRKPGGSWQPTAYQAGTQHTYASLAPGLYSFEVDVRSQGETVAYDAVTVMQYQVNGCTSATLIPTPTGTASHGTVVTAVANA